MFEITQKTCSWPVAGSFRIAHGSLSTIEVVLLRITASVPNHPNRSKTISGQSECRPYARYNETPVSIMAQISAVTPLIKDYLLQQFKSTPRFATKSETISAPSADPEQFWLKCIQTCSQLLPHGAAQNALNCALMDWVAQYLGKPVWDILGLARPQKRVTAFTLSIDSPAKMAQAAVQAAHHPILKLKIKDMSGLSACLAVLQARPDAQIILDANEALRQSDIAQLQSRLADKPVLMIEQPVRADKNAPVSINPLALPIICADESLHSIDDLSSLWAQGYRAVNVKLDKAGGVEPACALLRHARAMGFITMAGCMVGSSLAMAPMMCLESLADFIDLDGPLLLSQDIKHGLHYPTPYITPPSALLWGG